MIIVVLILIVLSLITLGCLLRAWGMKGTDINVMFSKFFAGAWITMVCGILFAAWLNMCGWI